MTNLKFSPPVHGCAYCNGRIDHFTIYLIDIENITKFVIK